MTLDEMWKRIDAAVLEERNRCASIVCEIKDQVREVAPGMEYHLVLAEKRIRKERMHINPAPPCAGI